MGYIICLRHGKGRAQVHHLYIIICLGICNCNYHTNACTYIHIELNTHIQYCIYSIYNYMNCHTNVQLVYINGIYCHCLIIEFYVQVTLFCYKLYIQLPLLL